MVLEEDGTTVKYNPIACTEVSPGTLKHGSCSPMIKGIRIRDGAYLEHAPILFDCAFDKRAVTATDSLETLLARDLYPVRRLLPAEEASFEQFYTRKPPSILQTIMQTIISEINEAAEREAAAATAAEAAEAGAAAAEPQDNDSVIFNAIFEFVNQYKRLPFIDEAENVRQIVINMYSREIDISLIQPMINTVQTHLTGTNHQGKNSRKKTQYLLSHYNLNSDAYRRLHVEGVKTLGP